MEEIKNNYTIAEDFVLPSKGLIYNKPIDPHVKLKSMQTKHELRRLSPSNSQFRTLAEIIDDCLITPLGMSSYDLCSGDYEYLLHKLRVVTYGDEYKMQARCPFCGEVFESTAHLEDLEVKEFNIDEFDKLKTVKLPKSGHAITLRYQTPRMLDEADERVKELKRKFKDANTSFGTLVALTYAIEKVDGMPMDEIKLESFIEKLPALDSMKILNAIDKLNNSIGLENELHLSCPSCGGEVLTSFRFGPEFFRPTNI